MKHPDLPQPPLERRYDLNRLSEAGYETSITANERDRAKIAEWADVATVKCFEGRITLKRMSPTRFLYAAHLQADIIQTCAVTLEPIESNISMEFTRILHLVSHVKRFPEPASLELTPAAGDDEVPEEIDDPHFDLAAPLLEEFLLAVDPYPRAEGVAFETPTEDEDKPESPFAVLTRLKEG